MLCIVLTALISCTPPVDGDVEDDGGEWIDYASTLKLDMSSNTLKLEATVKSFIDGDTTHFYVDQTKCEKAKDGVLKARYIAINTPESTGKIEPWGKAASNFTRSKLENAVSIILETDSDKWELDSTGERHLVWVWYRNSANEPYRNLNVEILQEGLAIASNTAQNRYGDVASKALAQATAMKLYCHSGVADPEVYRGDAIEVSIKEIRLNNGAVRYFTTKDCMSGGTGDTVYCFLYDLGNGEKIKGYWHLESNEGKVPDTFEAFLLELLSNVEVEKK